MCLEFMHKFFVTYMQDQHHGIPKGNCLYNSILFSCVYVCDILLYKHLLLIINRTENISDNTKDGVSHLHLDVSTNTISPNTFSPITLGNTITTACTGQNNRSGEQCCNAETETITNSKCGSNESGKFDEL